MKFIDISSSINKMSIGLQAASTKKFKFVPQRADIQVGNNNNVEVLSVQNTKFKLQSLKS